MQSNFFILHYLHYNNISRYVIVIRDRLLEWLRSSLVCCVNFTFITTYICPDEFYFNHDESVSDSITSIPKVLITQIDVMKFRGTRAVLTLNCSLIFDRFAFA